MQPTSSLPALTTSLLSNTRSDHAKEAAETVTVTTFHHQQIEPNFEKTKELLNQFETELNTLGKDNPQALAPALEAIYEAVEVVNNFPETKSLTDLKEVQDGLSAIIKKGESGLKYAHIKGCKPRNPSLHPSKKTEEITEALSKVAKEKISLIEKNTPNIKNLNIDQIIDNCLSKFNPESRPINEIIDFTEELKKAKNKIGQADKISASKINVGKDLSDRVKEIKVLKGNLGLISQSLNIHFKELQSALESENHIPDWGISETELYSLIEVVDAKIATMSEILKAYTEYNSPFSIKNICDSKKIEINSAIKILESHEKMQPESEAKKAVSTIIDTLKQRLNNLDHPNKIEDHLDASKLLGETEITGFGRFLHPFDAAIQALSLNKMANRLMRGGTAVKGASLQTVHFTEKMLMQELLKKAGIKNTRFFLDEAINKELNSQPWAEIKSEFFVPKEKNDITSQVQVISITTHAGEILNNPKRVNHVPTESPLEAPLNKTSCGEYVVPYAPLNTSGIPVTGGFNSHDTAAIHATAAAQTVCKVGDTTLFGATRSGVNAAYGLTQKHLLSLPQAESAKIIRSLIVVEEQKQTEIEIKFNGNNKEKTTSAGSGSALEKPQVIKNEIQGLIKKTIEQLRPGQEMRAVLAKSDLLVSLAGESQPLCDLLARQAALNRTREVFLLEMARDPSFMTKIANGKPIFFSSISLLTPDHLRDTLNRKFGMSADSNEKAMLATQLKGWEDLQSEINADGIVINGRPVKAKIVAFNFGVNEGGVGLASDPAIGELVSGWAEVNGTVNDKAMISLLGQAEVYLKENKSPLEQQLFIQREFPELIAAQNKAAPSLVQEKTKLAYDVKVAEQLVAQIDTMWKDGSYKIAGNEPYKLASRVALLSFILGGGTTFNCKSGKDRTGQLDVEAKLLAFQIHANDGEVPLPNRKRSEIEINQLHAFTFQDKSRGAVQKLNTGFIGSRLEFGPVLNRMAPEDREAFLGVSSFTKA